MLSVSQSVVSVRLYGAALISALATSRGVCVSRKHSECDSRCLSKSCGSRQQTCSSRHAYLVDSNNISDAQGLAAELATWYTVTDPGAALWLVATAAAMAALLTKSAGMQSNDPPLQACRQGNRV